MKNVLVFLFVGMSGCCKTESKLPIRQTTTGIQIISQRNDFRAVKHVPEKGLSLGVYRSWGY